MQDVQAGHEIVHFVEIAQGEALEERAFELQGPQLVGRRLASVRETHRPVRESRNDRRFFAGGSDPDRLPRTQINRDQPVRIRGQPQLRAGARELDDERAAFQCRDASDSQLGIETVGEVVSGCPVATRC
jgi:hypothetical protein